MDTGARVAICPMTTSANTGLVTYLPTAQTLWAATFVPVAKVIEGTVTNVPTSMNVPTPPSHQSVWRTQSVVTSPPTMSANARAALKAMEKSSAEISTSVTSRVPAAQTPFVSTRWAITHANVKRASRAIPITGVPIWTNAGVDPAVPELVVPTRSEVTRVSVCPEGLAIHIIQRDVQLTSLRG